MKKPVFLILSIILIILLSSCSDNNNLQSDTEALAAQSSSTNIKEGEERLSIFDRILIDNTQKLNYTFNTKKQIQEAIGLSMETVNSNTGKFYTYEEIEKTVGIKQLRYCMTVDSGKYYYSIHECDIGKLFIFYLEKDDVFFLDKSLFFDKVLSFKDFDSLKEGISTYDDVKNIDPATEFDNIFAWAIYQPKTPDGITHIYNNFTVHMTNEGYVSIGYKVKNGVKYVDCIDKVNDEIIKSINKLDLSTD